MMDALITLIVAILRLLLPAITSRDTSPIDAAPDPIADKLQSAIRDHWRGAVFPILLILIMACGGRVVYQQPGEPVRLRETVRSVKVWVRDADGNVMSATTDLMEGGYYIPYVDLGDD